MLITISSKSALLQMQWKAELIKNCFLKNDTFEAAQKPAVEIACLYKWHYTSA